MAYFGYALLGLGLIALVADRVLDYWAAQGKILSQTWVAEDNLINRENYKKNLSSARNPLVHTAGMPLPRTEAGRRRILVVGDSFIWGDGLTNLNMTWWRQLQWDLERRGFHDVDVVAAGISGASTQDQLEWLSKDNLLGSVKPDVVVFGYVTNDADMKDASGERLVKQFVPSHAADSNATLSYLGDYFPSLAFQLADRVRKKQESTGKETEGYSYNTWELKILEGQNFAQYKSLLAKLHAFFDEAKVPMFVVSTPNSPSAEMFEPRYSPIRTAFSEAGIEFHDFLPPFIACCGGDVGSQLTWGVNPANGHPGARATQFYASQVADVLEKNYRTSLGNKRLSAADDVPAINDWMPASLAPRSVAKYSWEFVWPERDTLLRMPVGEPHVALNFQRPVSIRDIRIAAPLATRFKVWAMMLDDSGNYEGRDYVLLGEGSGASLSLSLQGELQNKRITSLRITAQFVEEQRFESSTILEPGKISQSEGLSFDYPLPMNEDSADTQESPKRSPFVLLEDGNFLPFPHALHDDIRKLGKGRYSHWKSALIFSSSDGSDPRNNGRRYVFAKPDESGRTVRVDFDFNTPAVRL
ncbi:hypothetical protein MoryE10_05330 [Methylogaea oryzae]|uniref:SGNH hydrolase-type esterase domain-containing protein n=1 Tax=Methylogaea oryzae TaxID=1295382 RepID=A0A8D4VNS2_9GAMM|nr:hypothetical protein MoryE10_05330 [Methylogaea oryzae]